jgi:hypothetical protein
VKLSSLQQAADEERKSSVSYMLMQAGVGVGAGRTTQIASTFLSKMNPHATHANAKRPPEIADRDNSGK